MMLSRAVLLSALVLAGGCRASASASIGGSVPAVNNAPVSDDLMNASAALAGCATGDLEANLRIVSELRDSYHEMIVCGGLAMDFNGAVINVLISAALGRGRGAAAFTYQGNGVYAAGNGLMAMRASFATDVAGGKLGDAIAFDILDPESYLVGVQVDASGAIDAAATSRGGALGLVGRAAGKLELRFTGEGPLFALLGLSQSEVAGGRLSIDPIKIMRSLADRIQLAMRVSVDDQKGGAKIQYILEGAPVPIRQTMSGRSVPMSLATMMAERSETGQTVKVTKWTMQYLGDGSRNMMDGEIGLDIDGGAFPYSVTFSYPHRKDPDVKLSCR